MKRSTRVIEVIEMTVTEERTLWKTEWKDRRVLGKRVQDWMTADGHNEILLDGEDTYLPVVRV